MDGDTRRGETGVGLIKALGLVAWADDRLAPEERDMLDTVLGSLDIPDARRKELCQALRAGPPTLSEVKDAFDDDVERRFALAQALIMAQVDGVVDPAETAQINALAKAFGVDDEELTMIRAAVDLTGDLLAGS